MPDRKGTDDRPPIQPTGGGGGRDHLEAALPGETAYWPVSAIAEILFCPRNFYYRFVEGAEESNEHTLEGTWAHQRREARATAIRNDRLQTRAVTVSSERLGLLALVDVVEEDDDIYPVEYKKGPLGEYTHDAVQVCAQAMALEDTIGRPVSFGYVYYAASRRRRRIDCGAEVRDLVLATIDQAHRIVSSGEIPPPVNDSRCRGCALQNRCLPWEVERSHSGVRPTQGARPTPSVNWGRVLYVDQAGAYVRKRGERAVVTKENEVLIDMPFTGLDEIVLVGRAGFSQAFADAVMDHGIPVHFVSPGGRYQGALAPARSRNVLLRLAQARAHFDEGRRLGFSRAFVEGKLANMRTLLRRYGRERQAPDLGRSARDVETLLGKVARAADRDELLGLEGAATRCYFSCFDRLLGEGLPFDFESRTRRPPRDPVNALLSFGYALLAKNAAAALEIAGLDPYIGLYHEVVYGRPALALDLMEEFRPLIGDAVAVAAVNRRILSTDDFENRGDGGNGTSGCYLTDAGRKAFFRLYEQRLSEEITHPLFGYKMTYRRMIELQARFLAKAIQGEFPTYRALRVR